MRRGRPHARDEIVLVRVRAPRQEDRGRANEIGGTCFEGGRIERIDPTYTRFDTDAHEHAPLANRDGGEIAAGKHSDRTTASQRSIDSPRIVCTTIDRTARHEQ